MNFRSCVITISRSLKVSRRSYLQCFHYPLPSSIGAFWPRQIQLAIHYASFSGIIGSSHCRSFVANRRHGDRQFDGKKYMGRCTPGRMQHCDFSIPSTSAMPIKQHIPAAILLVQGAFVFAPGIYGVLRPRALMASMGDFAFGSKHDEPPLAVSLR